MNYFILIGRCENCDKHAVKKLEYKLEHKDDVELQIQAAKIMWFDCDACEMKTRFKLAGYKTKENQAE
jgi:hypothetical protein